MKRLQIFLIPNLNWNPGQKKLKMFDKNRTNSQTICEIICWVGGSGSLWLQFVLQKQTTYQLLHWNEETSVLDETNMKNSWVVL